VKPGVWFGPLEAGRWLFSTEVSSEPWLAGAEPLMRISNSTLTIASLLLASTAAHAANRPPVLTGTPPASVQVLKTYRFFAKASDADGDAVTFSIANKPAWAWFDSKAGILGGEPKALGTYSNIVVSASDGKSTVSLPAFSITATGGTSAQPSSVSGNHAPVVTNSPARKVTVGYAYVYQPKSTDADGDRLTYSIVNKPSWATFSTSNGFLMGWPKATSAGTYSNVTMTVSDGKTTVVLPTFSIVVNDPNNATVNAAPKLTGTPATQIASGSAYSFQPSASDPNSDVLAFSISNKPSWATFNTATGRLSGSPQAANVGTYANIAVSVSDGKIVTSLPAFSIAVTQVQASMGNASLSWTAPTQNTDGSALVDLSGYRIYYGTSASALNQVIDVPSASTLSYVVERLTSGSYFFAVKAVAVTGAESALSALGSKTIQ
jgi:hypothetical protein